MPYVMQRLFAVLGLLVSSPVLAAAALAIRMKDGSPVLFKQMRVGRERVPFKILKLRTMVNDADQLLANDPHADRITTTGRFLRKSSIDELPQLWNVARGDMALVGPRAMLPEVARNIPGEFETRFRVLPGLTGLAQVRGRNALVWSRRLAADVEYVARRSVTSDLRIIASTARVLLRGHGFKVDRNTEQVDDLGLLKSRDD